MAPEVSPRATEVLDRLARQQSSRPLFRRVPRIDLPTAGGTVRAGAAAARAAPDTDGGTGSDTHRVAIVRRELQRRRRRLPPGARWGLVALVVAVLVGFVVLQRRPPPIEHRLPMASAEQALATDPGDGTAAPEQSGAAADPVDSEPGPGGSESEGRDNLFVHVAGAVTAPGVVELAADSRVVDAVRAAGGLRADADPDRVNLAAPIADGQRVVVPVLGQHAPPEVPLVPASGEGHSTAGTTGEATARIDVNTASATELEELPGVGPATASAIIAHRESEGPFTSIESLLDVRGIGDAKLDAMRDLVVVSGGG